MPATVNVEFWNAGTAGAPTKTNATAFRFRTDDSPATISTTNPCVIPTSSFNYSYWQHIALALSGTFTQINNVRFYTDGAIAWDLGTSGEIRRGNRDTGDKGCPVASYVVATGTAGTTGNDLADVTNGHSYFNAQTTKTAVVTGDTSGAPATIDSGNHTVAESTKAVVLQAKIASDATQGTKTAETFTILYDEI